MYGSKNIAEIKGQREHNLSVKLKYFRNLVRIICVSVCVFCVFIGSAFSTEEFCGKKNQLVQNGNFINTNHWTASYYLASNSNGNNLFAQTDMITSNNVLSLSGAANSTMFVPNQSYTFTANHKYLVIASIKVSDANKFGIASIGFAGAGSEFQQKFTPTTSWQRIGKITTNNANIRDTWYMYFPKSANATSLEGETVYIKDFNGFDLTEMFGSGNEPTTVADAESKIAEVFGYTADYYPYDPGTDYCIGDITQVKVATTKYVETKFAPAVNELNTTMGTIKNVVDNTIIQADRIGKLHTGKQNRPDEQCPKGRECLLITEADGSLHWYPICDADGSVEPIEDTQ